MIKITQTSLLDSQLLSSIHAQAFQDMQKPWSADIIYHTLLQKHNHSLTAYDDNDNNNQPLGFIIYSLITNIESEILTICTIKARSGIATALMDQMIAHTKDEQVERILLDVAVDNTKAISLYEKFGFQEIAIRKNYYKRDNTSIDAKIMKKQFAK